VPFMDSRMHCLSLRIHVTRVLVGEISRIIIRLKVQTRYGFFLLHTLRFIFLQNWLKKRSGRVVKR